MAESIRNPKSEIRNPKSEYTPKDRVPLPPPDAKMVTTACDYCIVACGYKVWTWPVGEEGGPKASENALGVDFPSSALGAWISPNKHNVVSVDGKPHNVVVLADPKSTVVNVAGNHSIRGGTLALKCYTEDGPTSDRLQRPMLRVNGKLTEVDWDTATDIVAAVSRHVIDNYGEPAWAMKMYSYQFFENTYACSKLAFNAVQTPAFAPHDKPGPGADTPGVSWAGIQVFGASYDDWGSADVLMISGTDPFETKTVLFTSWLMGRPKMIMVLPRKTAGAAYAEATGGMFLQITPGTDSLLHMAMARYILEQGWEDQEFIENWISNTWEIDSGMGRGTRNTPWQWATTWGKLGNVGFPEYKAWLLNYEFAELDKAAEITGIPAEQIKQAAQMVSGGGERIKASFAFEKGNYWSQNWVNTASYAALGIICGAGNRPGQMIGRLGGHQRGWMGAASYPRGASPHKLPGRRKQAIDLDRWVEAGKVRFAWAIGTPWIAGMTASQELEKTFRDLTVNNPNQVTRTDKEAAVEALIKRVDSGGTVAVWQNIYLQPPFGTDIADIVLPAATWGEEDFTRMNGERRLRLYSKFYDPPGEAKPDWWIIGQVATKMGYQDFDWQSSNQVFEESARFGRGSRRNYHPLVWLAKKKGVPAHELLRELGTHGIQAPVRWYPSMPQHAEPGYAEYAGFYEDPDGNGVIVGTKRLHDSTLALPEPIGPTVHQKWLTHFSTQVGKAVLLKSPWEEVSDFWEAIKPDPDKGEFWVTNGRINELWQSGFDDRRKPYMEQRWPADVIFAEIHPDDAAKIDVESGDMVRLWSDKVYVQTGSFVQAGGREYRFSELQKAGLIREGKGEIEAVVIVTDAVKPGVIYTYFLSPEQPSNALVHRVTTPFILRYRYKLGTGMAEKIGESPYKDSFEKMSFKPRTVMQV